MPFYFIIYYKKTLLWEHAMNTNTTDNIRTPASYIMKNQNGMEVEILSAGAAISRILVPDLAGNFENIVLSFADKSTYYGNSLYAGAILGPVAGRISGARLPLNNSVCHLTKNDGDNHLHGGHHSLSFLNWNLQSQTENHGEGTWNVVLHAFLPDGTDGFPGNRHFTASYTLCNDNSLILHYSAVSDQDTYFNLSNHSYFNLSGDFTVSALTQNLQIKAEDYVENNAEHLPIGFSSVSGTPFDFNIPCTLKENMKKYPKHPQLLQAEGYNNGFALSSPTAVLSHKATGRRMELSTDAPCLVLYSGGYIPDDLLLAGNIFSSPSCAVALEAQDFPDAPNCPAFSRSYTKAGERFNRLIRYQFKIG